MTSIRGALCSVIAGALILLLCTQVFGQTQVLYTADGSDYYARGEVQRWYMNRMRFHPEMDADRVGLTNSANRDYDICEDADGSGVFGSTTNEWAVWKRSLRPLAPNQLLSWCCYIHGYDMAAFEGVYFGHASPDRGDGFTPGYDIWWVWELAVDPTPGDGAFMYYDRWWQFSQVYGPFEWDSIEYAGENMSRHAALNFPDGYHIPATGEDVHNGFLTDFDVASRSHRVTFLQEQHREGGFDCFQDMWEAAWPTPPPDTVYNAIFYDVQDFAVRTGWRFFTGTIFYDDNQDSDYDEGEGVGGIEIRLLIDGVPAGAWYDISHGVGSFAIPLYDDNNGETVTVQLGNTSAAPVTISIPRNYCEVGELTLGAGETVAYSTFVQPAGINVGFRNTEPIVAAEDVALGLAGTTATVSFGGSKRLTYRIESTDGLIAANWETVDTITCTGQVVSVVDTGQNGRGAPDTVASRFYRAILVDNDDPM